MCKRFHVCKGSGECSLKNAGQNSQKKPVITLIFKLKALVICTNFDLAWKRHLNLIISNCLSCHKNLVLDQENAHELTE